MTQRVLRGLVLFVLCVGLARSGEAQSSDVKSLRGLPGLFVLVEHLNADAEADGLREADILTDVELQLRLAGIKVLSQPEWLAHPAFPEVYINVSTKNRKDGPAAGIYAYSIVVGVKQRVRVWSGELVLAQTWDTGSVGHVGASNLRSVREPIKDRVNQLVNAWLTVNPR